MKTKRLVSSISYNSPAFLREALARLVDCGLIEWAHWVHHKAEEDEEKDHFHLVLMPARQLDTVAVQKHLEEVDINRPGKPLGALPFRFSGNLDDWLLYAVHDPAFLASKGQVRKYHYPREAVESTCPDLLREQWHEVNLAKYGLGQQLADAVGRGIPWEQVVASGLIPPAQWTFWREVFYSLRSGSSVRPLRSELTHTPKRSDAEDELDAMVERWERGKGFPRLDDL